MKYRAFFKKSTIIGLSLLGSFMGVQCGQAADINPKINTGVKHVSMTAIIEHQALNAVRDGAKDYLRQHGFGKDKLEITYESAQGNPAIAAQIAQKLVGRNPDVVLAIGTPSAQALVALTDKLPIVFAAVTDPVEARLLKNLKQPQKNVTGVSDLSPIQDHLDIIRKVFPKAQRLGVIYNPGESNSVVLINKVKALAPKYNFKVVEVTAPRTSEIPAATQHLMGKVDVIYLVTDNTVMSTIESIVGIATENKIPVVVADSSGAQKGAVLGLGVDYHKLGERAGAMVAKILNSQKIDTIPVVFEKKTHLIVNMKAAKKMDITIPASILKQATKIIR